MLGACRLREGSSPEGIDWDRLLSLFFLDLAGNVQHMTQSFIINNRDGVNFRQPIIGGIGEQHIIQAQFLMPVRIVPDIDILPDSPSAVFAVLNQIKHLIVLYSKVF